MAKPVCFCHWNLNVNVILLNWFAVAVRKCCRHREMHHRLFFGSGKTEKSRPSDLPPFSPTFCLDCRTSLHPSAHRCVSSSCSSRSLGYLSHHWFLCPLRQRISIQFDCFSEKKTHPSNNQPNQSIGHRCNPRVVVVTTLNGNGDGDQWPRGCDQLDRLQFFQHLLHRPGLDLPMVSASIILSIHLLWVPAIIER